jgi:hypothetical protein
LYGLPERWEQKKKAPGLVAPALLPVINLVDRVASPGYCVALITYLRGDEQTLNTRVILEFPFFKNLGNLVCPSPFGGGV